MARSGQLVGRLALVMVTALVGATAVVTAGGFAADAAPSPPPPTVGTPRFERDMTNVDVLRQQIRNYYGDPTGTGIAASDGNYAKEVESVIAAVSSWLRRPHDTEGVAAVVFDVDDTVLLNYGYTIFSNWAFNATSFTTFVTEQWFPAIPGMLELVRTVEREGYAIFFITGRYASVEQATLGNLTADGLGVDAGFPQPTRPSDGEDGLYTVPLAADYPDYLAAACAADPAGTCTTAHYKSATRAHLEALGYHIVANIGDQLSDLEGGHADRAFKMPNPNYIVP